jgi:hypothetical protein
VEISPDTIPADLWPAIVGGLDLHATPPSLSGHIAPARCCPPLTDATVAALIEAVQATLAEYTESQAIEAARREGDVVTFEQGGISRTTVIELGGYTWEKWVVGYISDYELSAEQLARVNARRSELATIVADHNAELAPAVEAAKAKYAEEKAARDAEEKAAKAAANAAKYAKRLETGFWEKETDSYNERRYGSYWCAKVTFPNGAKPAYEWGESTAKWGKAGLLRIECKPGEIIAWGQKDLRHSDRSEHKIQVMEADGRMRTIDATEAFRLYQAAQ